MNKRNKNFIHTDELAEANQGTKQTLASMFRALEAKGVNTEEIKENIMTLIGKTLVAIQAGLSNLFYSQLKQAKVKNLKCFQIIGVDVLIDKKLKPWLIEINGNPSLRIDFEQ